MPDTITQVRAGTGALEVTWTDGGTSRFPWLWLRDHCRSAESLHPETLQRLVDTAHLPEDLHAREVSLKNGGSAVEIAWAPEDHVSLFDARFLRALARPAASEPPHALWDGSSFPDGFPAVAHGAVMPGEAGLRTWLEAIERRGFALVEDVPVTIEDTKKLAERIAYVRETIFGGFWDFTADLKHGDTAYTNLEVKLHTDGTYSIDPPGLQMFHCLSFDGEGGETILVDGFAAAEALRRADSAAFETLTRVQVPGQYIEPGVHLSARHPVIALDEGGELGCICFNNHDRAPFLLPEAEMTAFYAALRAFVAILEDPARQLRFTLRPGAVLTFDNWRVLHGRGAYVGKRHLAGCYINREDFKSRLRVLRMGS